MVGSGDEIWVLARGAAPTERDSGKSPAGGELLAQVGQKQVPLPLKHTNVRASISGPVSSVQVVQQFHNPYSSKIEALYVFPLPHHAAVHEFIMTIGERRIRGIIRERKEAEEIYDQAKRRGYVASLLTEERPNVFTQSVANIEPSRQIDIRIQYFQTLEHRDGWYEFVFPTVVGPRFNPPGSREGVGVAARGQEGVSGQKTEVQYLRPDERSGHDISLSVNIDAGVRIEELECKTHEIETQSDSPDKVLVLLRPEDTIPNRDFVLRYRVAAEGIKSSLMTFTEKRGGYFTLALYPPAELEMQQRQPLELVFVIDCSGSMSGKPITTAKQAVKRGLELLQPGDSFQLINFSMSAASLGTEPLAATQENVERALAYLQSLRVEGGTMMIEGVKAALDFPHSPHRLRFVCFLTDGYIGNESEILKAIQERLGASRIFSFGIGSSVNRFLMDHMARTGRGAVAYLGPREDAAGVMEIFFERISHPAMTDLRVEWGGLEPVEVFPAPLPDLFVGRPVILTGRFRGQENATIRVTGTAAGRTVSLAIAGERADIATAGQALPVVWARAKVAALANESIVRPNHELPERVKAVALEYGLMSAFTAFVAVDSTRVTEGTEGTTVPVAVPVPEGVEYDTTVGEN